MAKQPSSFERWCQNVESFWDETAFLAPKPLSRLQRFIHFWVMVCKSFVRNRCPIRASSLAYATLLALIPVLAVAVSISSTFLKQEGEDEIDRFIVRLVASVTPPAVLSTNADQTAPTVTVDRGAKSGHRPASSETTNALAVPSPAPAETVTNVDESALPSFAKAEDAVRVRKDVARTIHNFIQNTRSGALGVTGSLVLIFVAISMLARIEDTFNDIWGVARGRTWFMRIVLYWCVITLAPLLVIVAAGLASGPHLDSTRQVVERMPFVGSLIFQVLPVVVLCLTFSLFYMLMPNAKVRWQAALVGGVTGGLLMHANNLVSVLYISRVVSYSRIYGGLGLVPVFMVGLYFAWLILLFGAQVAYAYQNRATYLEEKQVEHIHQRGREFVALRLMTLVAQRFVGGQPPPTVGEIACELTIPSRLVRQIMQTMAAARLVVETAGLETAYLPARPVETITCHDILVAMRSTVGHELATTDEPFRTEVYGEFQRIQEAERQAASSVTMLTMVNRARASLPQPATVEKCS